MKRTDVVNTVNALQGEAGHKKVLEVYNSQQLIPRGYKLKYSDAWCAATVSAVMIMNGYSYISECSCSYMIEKAKKLGIWVENDAYKPSCGDIIMYDWQDTGIGDNKGVPDHTGIIVDVAVAGNTIYVREGNKSGTIGNRVMRVNGSNIRGYIVPPYDKDGSIYTEDTPLRVIVDDVIAGHLGNGDIRKNNIYNIIQGLVNERLTK